jgi:DNA-directed RNA polymerase III subunit RPC1
MIPDADLPLIMMHKSLSRPEWMVLTHVPVPPASIRPSVVMDASGSNEDDLTVQIGQIISLNRVLRGEMQKGGLVLGIIERWDVLQDVVAELYNAEAPGLQSKLSAAGSKKAIRGICQRLKGKQGRFRGNLSGKRVDFSSRTVISPDPNLRIDEVCHLSLFCTLVYWVYGLSFMVSGL